MTVGEMDAYKDAFLAESTDYLQQITEGLLALEAEPADLGPVEVIFRGAHSLKGMSAAMNYQRTADLTHKMEGLMDRVRKQEILVTRDLINLMLGAIDLVRDLIDDEAGGTSNVDPAEMIAALEAATHASAEAAEQQSDPAALPAAASAVRSASGDTMLVKVTLEESCVLKAVRAYMVIKRLAHMGDVVETHPSAREIEDEAFDRSFEVVLATTQSVDAVEQAASHVSEVASVEITKVEMAAVPADSADADGQLPVQARRARALPKLSQTQTVRVSIGHLDTLVDLVGELVILRSRLERIADGRRDSELAETVDELQRISTDLQYEVMQTRMVPVGNIFNRFPRMVRDLAIDLGKRVEFRMSGLEIELDRTVLDEIGDPLVHLLRNSIDHGIEDDEVRREAGKPATGTVTLSATRERDHVAIIVSDDGKGINPDKVWRKAVQKGLVREEDRPDYDDSAIFLLTCVPGFSTMEKATKVSGRGVGMDVVKGKIEHLGGTVQIRSRVGVGTDFVLRLPLTLAIVQALLVESRGQMFALPLSSVDEVVLAEEVVIDTLDGAPVVIWREGTVVPLQRLDAILFGADPHQLPQPRSSIVLVQSGDEQRALNVDALGGRLEVVIKPLSRVFKDSKGFSGATILGDGRVMLILD
ncbi:MAG: chemotaxis protein CheA, partial [Actinobacteria bacterium]